MRTVVICMLACSVPLAMSGCGWSAGDGADKSPRENATGGVAVVDLDIIAKYVGRDQEMAESLKQKETDLNDQITQLHQGLRNQFLEKQKQYGETPTEEQSKELRSLNAQMVSRIQAEQRRAFQEINSHQQNLVRQFRSDMKPAIQQVAAEEGLSLVVPKNDQLFLSVDPQAEITDKVIHQLKAEMTVKPTPKRVAETGSVDEAPQ